MSRIKDFYNKYLSRINAYWLVTIVFFALTFVMGDSSPVSYTHLTLPTIA